MSLPEPSNLWQEMNDTGNFERPGKRLGESYVKLKKAVAVKPAIQCSIQLNFQDSATLNNFNDTLVIFMRQSMTQMFRIHSYLNKFHLRYKSIFQNKCLIF